MAEARLTGVDWNSVWDELQFGLQEIVDQARERYPEISAGVTRPLGGYPTFYAYASFWHDIVNQEHEDLLVRFQCSATDRGPFWDAQGRSLFPSEQRRDAVGFWIERGNGEILASLEPVLLPADTDSTEYELQVMDYVQRTLSFLREQTDLILESLAVRE